MSCCFAISLASCTGGHIPSTVIGSTAASSRFTKRCTAPDFNGSAYRSTAFFLDGYPVVRLHGHQVAWSGWRCGCPQRVRTAQSQGRIQATHFRGAQPVLDRLNVLLPRRRLLRQSSPPGGPQGGAKIKLFMASLCIMPARGVEDGPQRPSRTRWRVPVCRVAPGGTMGSAGNKGEPGRLCGWETDAPSLRSRVLPGGAI